MYLQISVAVAGIMALPTSSRSFSRPFPALGEDQLQIRRVFTRPGKRT